MDSTGREEPSDYREISDRKMMLKLQIVVRVELSENEKENDKKE